MNKILAHIVFIYLLLLLACSQAPNKEFTQQKEILVANNFVINEPKAIVWEDQNMELTKSPDTEISNLNSGTNAVVGYISGTVSSAEDSYYFSNDQDKQSNKIDLTEATTFKWQDNKHFLKNYSKHKVEEFIDLLDIYHNENNSTEIKAIALESLTEYFGDGNINNLAMQYNIKRSAIQKVEISQLKKNKKDVFVGKFVVITAEKKLKVAFEITETKTTLGISRTFRIQ